MSEDSAGVGVVAGEFLGDLVGVAFVSAGLIVGNDGAGGLELVEDFGDGDDKAMAGEEGGGAANGAGDLEDFGEEEQAGIFSVGGGTENVGAHGAGGGGEVDGFFFDGHGGCPYGASNTLHFSKPRGKRSVPGLKRKT